MRKVLLDTNAYSGLLSGDKLIFEAIARAEEVYISMFVLAELLYGFKGGRKEHENRKILGEFLLKPTVKIINATMDTAEIFSHIKNNLKKAGTPLPINDIWIASHTFESGSTIITYDKYFRKVPGLIIWDEL